MLLVDNKKERDWSIFLASVFFVLGFSTVFSILGVLLQTTLSNVSAVVQEWLARAGGLVIIIFGFFLLNLFTPKFLTREHSVQVRWRFKSYFLTSFVFGAAFAVGWTPCVTAALGAILALSATAPGSAFILLFSYTLGIGVPFMVVGLFTEQAKDFINRAGRWLIYIQYLFGILLIAIGILVFTQELGRLANFASVTEFLTSLNIGTSAGGDISGLNAVNLGIAFFAGLASFLSPCILPIVPGFLSYLASTAVSKSE